MRKKFLPYLFWVLIQPFIKAFRPSLSCCTRLRRNLSLKASTAPTISTRLEVPDACWTSDEQVFTILSELRVKPPWGNQGTPECSTRTFNYILRRLAESQLSFAGARAEAVLRYMLQSSSRPTIQPDVVTLNTVLDAYSKSRTKSKTAKQQRALSARRLFGEWQVLHQQGLVPQDVDRISYNTLISAFGKADMPHEAEEVFESLKKRYNDGDERYRPDSISCSALVHAYAKVGDATKVGGLFQQMQQGKQPLSIHSYNGVLYAYSKSEHPSAAEEFLQWWIEEDKSHVRPDTRSYNIVLHAIDKMSNRPDSVQRAQRVFASIPKPDKISFTTLASIVSKLPGRKALDEIARIVNKAWRAGFIRVDSNFLSNILYSVALCDDRGMPHLADRLVRDAHVRGMKRDVTLYNALMYCWTNSFDREATRRVMDLLTELEASDSHPPDMKSYTTVLTCLSRSKDPKSVRLAESILQKMEKQGMTPNLQAYTAMIQNYARSSLRDKATRAANLLTKMKQQKSNAAQPNVVSYNAVLNACEHTDASDNVMAEEALKIACRIFEQVRLSSEVAQNHVTYGTFVGVLANLMPPETRHDIVELVFRRCCMEGQVSKLVLKKLHDAVGSDEEYESLLRGHKEHRLPVTWTCNVQESRARHFDE